jgi:hypothetical protein
MPQLAHTHLDTLGMFIIKINIKRRDMKVALQVSFNPTISSSLFTEKLMFAGGVEPLGRQAPTGLNPAIGDRPMSCTQKKLYAPPKDGHGLGGEFLQQRGSK